MRNPWLALAVALSACRGAAPGDLPPGAGPTAIDQPSWQERAVLVLTNAIRIAPADWKSKWAGSELATVLSPSNYPAVGPIRWNAQLGASARAHSQELATAGCPFQHDSCDGTSWSTRIKAYYKLSGSIGENIAGGYPDPEAVMEGWICDSPDNGQSCCADTTGCDGHRANMMNAGWQAIGVGWAEGGTYHEYCTQDFGGRSDAATPPLVDGSHLFRASGKTTFLANFYTAAAPQSVSLVLAGATQLMTQIFGQAGKGTWSLELTAGTGCRDYHFTALDAGGASWRYPESGELVTFGEGSCTTDFRN